MRAAKLWRFLKGSGATESSISGGQPRRKVLTLSVLVEKQETSTKQMRLCVSQSHNCNYFQCSVLYTVASKLWLGSCRHCSWNRQACSSATYLFKWVQKFSASWQRFFPFVLYQSVNLLTSPSISSDLRQAGWVYWCLYRHITASSEECRSEGK